MPLSFHKRAVIGFPALLEDPLHLPVPDQKLLHVVREALSRLELHGQALHRLAPGVHIEKAEPNGPEGRHGLSELLSGLVPGGLDAFPDPGPPPRRTA